MKLTQRNLPFFPVAVSVPAYDRNRIKAGIAHIGIGGFHRAHQAYYTDELLQAHHETNWGICGICLLESDRRIFDILSRQDGLYTLLIREASGKLSARVIGSIVEHYFAPEDPQRVIKKLADPDIRIITLTITEGGYNFDARSNEFLWNSPAVEWDLKNPHQPKSVFGYLTQALAERRRRGGAGLTIQSCDNIQHNGEVTRAMLLAFVSVAEPDLVDWIEDHVAFPNSMVDRITPVTSADDIASLKETYGIEDEWPVACEPFCQWIIQDNFTAGRPPWEKAGAQFVQDVAPYEKSKIRLINGGHALLGLTGYLSHYTFIDEAASDPLLAAYLNKYMDEEVGPTLEEVAGLDIAAYKESVLRRFANPNIKDTVARIILGSSAKLPKFILPTLRHQLAVGGPIKIATTIIACWCRYLELTGTPGYTHNVQDDLRDILIERAKASVRDEPRAFLGVESVFGNLIDNKRFTDTYLSVTESIRRKGIKKVIESQLNDLKVNNCSLSNL